MRSFILLAVILSILCGSAIAHQMSGVILSGAVNGLYELIFCVDDSTNFYVDDEGNNYVL